MDEARSIPTRWIPAYEAFSGGCDGRRHHKPGSGGGGLCVGYYSSMSVHKVPPRRLNGQGCALEGKERPVGYDRGGKAWIFYFFIFLIFFFFFLFALSLDSGNGNHICPPPKTALLLLVIRGCWCDWALFPSICVPTKDSMEMA